MRMFLYGRKVGKGFVGCYLKNRAYFKREGLEKRITLHKIYHHLVESNGLEFSAKVKEREANSYARDYQLNF